MPPTQATSKEACDHNIFSKDDDDGIQFLHDDGVVIILNIENYDVHCILIDNRSLVNILYFDILLKMDISLERLVQVNLPLIGFKGDTI